MGKQIQAWIVSRHMNTTNLTAPLTSNPTEQSRYPAISRIDRPHPPSSRPEGSVVSRPRIRPFISLAGLVTAAASLVGCSFPLDLGITNTCGEDVDVGIEGAVESPLDGWYPVTDGAELVLSVSGRDKVYITVVPAGADQIFDHTEIDLSDLETTTANGPELAHLDLATEGLCS